MTEIRFVGLPSDSPGPVLVVSACEKCSCLVLNIDQHAATHPTTETEPPH